MSHCAICNMEAENTEQHGQEAADKVDQAHKPAMEKMHGHEHDTGHTH